MSKKTNDEIDQLKEQLIKWPYSSICHDKLICILRVDKKERIADLHEARQNKAQYFSLSAMEIADWLEDLQIIEDNDYRIKYVLEFYRFVVEDYPTSQYWNRYLEFVLDNYYANNQNVISETTIKGLFKEALNDTVHDFKNGKEIWDIVLKFFNNEFDSNGNEEVFDTLLKLHFKRISYPHETLKESFSQLSSLISKYDPSHYEKHMLSANKVFSKTLKVQRYYEKFEIEILKNSGNLKTWIDYMELINNFTTEVNEVSTLFYRAITSRENRSIDDPQWISIWLAYIYILYQEEIDVKMEVLEPILLKFIKTYPGSAMSYAEYIRNCAIFEDGFELFSVTKRRILGLDIMHNNNYDDWKVLALAILSYEFSLVHSGENIDLVSDLYTDATSYVEFALENNNDMSHSVEKLVVSIYETLDDQVQARSVITKLLENFSDKCEIWIYAYEFERRNNSSYEIISSLLETAVDNSEYLDWPEKVIQEWLSFEQIRGNIHSYEKALAKVDKKIRQMILKRMYMQEVVESELTEKLARHTGHDEEGETSRKRSRSNSMNALSRNREEFSIKISNLPQNITEEKLLNFFNDCGIPKEIKLFQEDNNEPEAIIEWNGSQELFAALTKNMKQISGREVSVIRIQESTLWVCNFPPSFTHDRIKDIFEDAGIVVSIRFPSLKLNQSRRFCYIEYSSPEIAHAALLKYQDKEFEDEISHRKYSLVVDISKSNPKKNKMDTVTEREIYIQNLNFKAIKKSDLETLFKSIGDIESIRIPLNEKMKGLGNINNGYAFVVFKSTLAAKNALQLSGTILADRKILISQSKQKKSNNNDEEKISGLFEDLNTISILNVSDTVNQDQISVFLAQRVGPVRQAQVFPKQEAALVEFEQTSDAGKASMLLTSEEFEGKVLQVGLKNDLNRLLHGSNLPSKKQKLMVPPKLLRRVRRK